MGQIQISLASFFFDTLAFLVLALGAGVETGLASAAAGELPTVSSACAKVTAKNVIPNTTIIALNTFFILKLLLFNIKPGFQAFNRPQSYTFDQFDCYDQEGKVFRIFAVKLIERMLKMNSITRIDTIFQDPSSQDRKS